MANFISIDFKLANPSDYSSVCAVALATVEKNEVSGRKYWLVKPKDSKFTDEAIAEHGITSQHVEDKQDLLTLWPTLVKYLENQLVIGTSSGKVDKNIFKSINKQTGAKKNSFVLTTLEYLVLKHKLDNKLSIKELAESMGLQYISHQTAENAAVSAQICVELFK